MKHAIVFSTLLAAAAGFFALGDAQRDTYRSAMLAEETVVQHGQQAIVVASNLAVAAHDHDDDDHETMLD